MTYRIEQVFTGRTRRTSEVVRVCGSDKAKARAALKDWRERHQGGASYVLVRVEEVAC